jgi:hypothetical protein
MVGIMKLNPSIAPVDLLIVTVPIRGEELMSANVADTLNVVSDDWAVAPVTRRQAQAKTTKLNFNPSVENGYTPQADIVFKRSPFKPLR